MISASSLVLDGHHGHGLGPGPVQGPGNPHHMAFVEPFLRNKLPVSVPEFIRPLPKPAPMVPRFNNHRPPPSQSPRKEYQAPVTNCTTGPVNLSSPKHDNDSQQRDLENSRNFPMSPHLAAAYTTRMFPPTSFHYPGLQGPYGSLYPSPYTSLLSSRPTYINSTPLISSLEQQYSPPTTSASSAVSSSPFVQPYNTQTAPAPPTSLPPPPPPQTSRPSQKSQLRERRQVKLPAGKDNPKHKAASNGRTKRIVLSASVNNNNNLLPPNFAKGALIQLGNGDLRRVEEVTTEDLISSADKCPAYRLDPATVVRIEENSKGTVFVTLSYAENKKSVEIESALEHPYFVYGRGWASCSPNRTISSYGLDCYRLQVGDVCMSLSPRQMVFDT